MAWNSQRFVHKRGNTVLSGYCVLGKYNLQFSVTKIIVSLYGYFSTIILY